MPRQPREPSIPVFQQRVIDRRKHLDDRRSRAGHGIHMEGMQASLRQHAVGLVQQRLAFLTPGAAGGIDRVGPAMLVERQIHRPALAPCRRAVR